MFLGSNISLAQMALATAHSGGGSTPLLDTYPSTAAYSVARLLRTAYAGDAILVRRASDNAEQAIGFVSGELDAASLATFCSGTDGFVKTVYDQQGSNDATQTTTSAQPKIYDSVTGVITSNGKPAAYYSGNSQVLLTSSALAIMTAKRHSTFTVSEQVSGASNVLSAFSTANWSLSMSIGSPTFVLFDGSWRTAASRTLSANVQYVAACIRSGDTTVDSYVNDSEYLANTCGDVAFGATVCGLGRHPTSSGAQVHYNQEWIHYANDQTANQVAIRANINAFYGAYV